MYEKTSWRKPNKGRPRFREEFDPLPTTRMFDQMWYVGDPNVCCFLLLTSEGFILIDCMFPGEHFLGMIEQGLADAGYSGHDLKAILLTHGHFDHYGDADILREKYGCKIYLSAVDYDFVKERADNEWKHPDPRFKHVRYEMDGLLKDGDEFTLGDTTIKCVLTPGHTPGSMSFIIPVTDEGRPHYAALWGGAGLIPESDKQAYLESLDHFDRVCDEYHVDVEIANHPFVDNAIQRLELIRCIYNGVPNPFVIGEEAFKRFQDSFRQECLQIIADEKLKGEQK